MEVARTSATWSTRQNPLLETVTILIGEATAMKICLGRYEDHLTWPNGIRFVAGVIALLLMFETSAISADLPSGSNSSIRVAAWNIEHLGINGESCIDRSEADFAALRAYARDLDADVVALQEISSIGAAEQIFNPDDYVLYLAERPFAGERPACWGGGSAVVEPDRLLGNHYTGFAVRKDLDVNIHADFADVGNLDAASGSNSYATDISVFIDGFELRLLSVHLKRGCVSPEDFYSDRCDYVSVQAEALRSWTNARRADGVAFGLVGDFNRNWDPTSPYWIEALSLSSKETDILVSANAFESECSYTPAFIDHVILEIPHTNWEVEFGQRSFIRYDRENFQMSDHCPVYADLIKGDLF